jgi:hypothetical protein
MEPLVLSLLAAKLAEGQRRFAAQIDRPFDTLSPNGLFIPQDR